MEGSRTSRPRTATLRAWPATTWRLVLVLAVVVVLLPPGADDGHGPEERRLLAAHTAGSLDATFGDGGIAVTEISSFVEPRDADVQVDGVERVLVLERFGRSVWRFHPDGRLDRMFHGDGVAPLAVTFTPERLAVSPSDAGFAVAGFGVGAGVRVAKYDRAGHLDTGFGTGGIVTVSGGTAPGTGVCAGVDLGRTFTGFSDLGVQSDGSIVVVGPGEVQVESGLEFCSPATREGLIVARVPATGGDPSVAGVAFTGAGETFGPRDLTIGTGGTELDHLTVSGAAEVLVGDGVLSPHVAVARLQPDLQVDGSDFGNVDLDGDGSERDGVAIAATASAGLGGARVPVAVGSDGSVAVVRGASRRAATGGGAEGPPAFDLYRWDGSGDVLDRTSAAFATDASSAPRAADLVATADGGFVAAGTTPFTTPTGLGVASYAPATGGLAGAASAIGHPGEPPTATAAISLVGLADGSSRVVGRAEPEVFGLDNHRQILLARLSASGDFDATFGTSGDGFAQHHGRYGDLGEALAVLPDGRIVVAGRIPETGLSLDPPSGFVLRHQDDATLDPGFAPDDLAGIEIARYATPPEPPEPDPVAPAGTSGSVAASVGGTGSMHLALQGVESTDVATEAELRAALSDPDEGHITLTADISLTDCPEAGDPGAGLGIERDSTIDVVLDGAGHTIAQTCDGERIVTSHGVGGLSLVAVTLTGGDPSLAGDQPSGGAVAAQGHVTVERAVLVGNTAAGGGGAIRASGVTVADSTFLDNHATAAAGGAIEVDGGLTVTTSVFEANTAAAGGGAVAASVGPVSVTDSSFTSNGAGGDGGGIWTEGAITVTNSVLAENTADSGGAIRVAGGTSGDGPPMAIVGSTFQGNAAGQFVGGAVYTTGPIGVSDSTFVDNVAVTNGGAIFAATESGPERVPGTVVGSVFRGNRVVGGGSFGPGDGGAIRVAGDITVVASTFADGEAAHGGAIYADTVTAHASRFVDNSALFIGGALHATEGATIGESTFEGNHAVDEGGAIFTYALEDVSLDGSTFALNTAGSGGAVWAEGGVRVTNSTFFDNRSEVAGSALWAAAAVSLTHVTIAQNLGASQVLVDDGVLTSFGSVLAGPGADRNCDLTMVTDSAYSHDTDGTCGFSGEGDASNGAAPQLGGLADNGGSTRTMAPATTSPLVSAIPSTVCRGVAVIDQRGVARPQGPACDIGAVEVFGSAVDVEVEALAVDGRGRYVIAGSTDFGSSGVAQRLLPEGGADPGFRDGSPMVLEDTIFHDVVVDGSDRILLVGNARRFDTFGLSTEVVVVRLLEDGSLDPAFGTAGVVRLEPGEPTGWDAWGAGIGIDAAGRVVLTGRSQAEPGSSVQHLLVARLLPDGSLDASFGEPAGPYGPGAMLGPVDHAGADVTVRGDDILVAGTQLTIGDGVEPEVEGFVARMTDVGELDPGFGSSGIAYPFGTAGAGGSVARGLAVDAVGNVVIAGGSVTASGVEGLVVEPVDLLLARVLATGELDPVFGDAGVVSTDVGQGAADQASDVAIAADGKIAVAGHVRDDRGRRVFTARYDPGATTLDCVENPTDLGTVGVGASTTAAITCAATEGTVVVTGLSIEPTPELPGDFDLVSDTCENSRLFAGQTCEVTVSFTPSTVADHRATVDVAYRTVTGVQTEPVGLRGTVRGARLELDPIEGPIGTEVEATGTDFDPGTEVELSIAGTDVATVSGEEVTSAGFTVSFEIPEGTAGGPQTVVACQRCAEAEIVEATAPFEVTARLFVRPSLSRPGGVVSARGDGFPADTPVTLDWEPGIGSVVVIADAAGEFTAPVLVFRHDVLGARELQASIAGIDEVAATAPLLAVPGSSQPRGFASRR